jgi:ribosomal protein L33
MAKKSTYLVQLVNAEITTKTKYIVKKPTRGMRSGESIALRKYDSVTQKHHLFKEKKMPSHSKN